MALEFCRSHSIAHERCGHFVQVDLDDSLWCRPGRAALAAKANVAAPRLLRFVHHEHYHDSEEFSLLRPRLVGNGFVECAAGGMDVITGEEAAVWVLGHFSGGNGQWLDEWGDGWARPQSLQRWCHWCCSRQHFGQWQWAKVTFCQWHWQ